MNNFNCNLALKKKKETDYLPVA